MRLSRPPARETLVVAAKMFLVRDVPVPRIDGMDASALSQSQLHLLQHVVAGMAIQAQGVLRAALTP
jgi:hypothetical protein